MHGRVVSGQDQNDEFTFAPMEQTCNLAALSPSKTIPMSGGSAATMNASSIGSATGSGSATGAPNNNGGNLSASNAPLGNATLSIVSGFPATPGQSNPLGNHPYVLLRNSFNDTIARSGVNIPAGTTPFKFLGLACGNRTPDCQTIMNAIKAGAASSVRADINGRATFPGVPRRNLLPDDFHTLQQPDSPVAPASEVNTGSNSITLDTRNASEMN